MPSYFVCTTISVNVITVIIGVIIGVIVAITVIFGIIYVQPSHLLVSIYKHPTNKYLSPPKMYIKYEVTVTYILSSGSHVSIFL